MAGSMVIWRLLFKLSDCFREHSFLYVCLHDHTGAGKVRLHFEHVAKLFNGSVVLVRVVKNCAVVGSTDSILTAGQNPCE